MHMVQSCPGPSVLSGRQHGSFGSLVLLSPQVKVALWFRLGGIVVDVFLSVPYDQDSSVQTSEGPILFCWCHTCFGRQNPWVKF